MIIKGKKKEADDYKEIYDYDMQILDANQEKMNFILPQMEHDAISTALEERKEAYEIPLAE